MSGETKKRLILSKWRGSRTEVAELRDQIKDLEDERGAYADDLERALVHVRYWLHDGLYMGRPVSNPRDVLRRVEDVLG